MDKLKKTVVYWRTLRNNEIDHGDIWAYRMLPIMSKLLLWWTDEDYKKTPKWAKTIYFLLSIRLSTCMILAFVFMITHWDSKPIPMLLQDGAICCSDIIACYGFFVFVYFRKRTSELMRTINETNRTFLQRSHNFLEKRRISNRLFILGAILCVIFQVSGTMTFALFAWDFAKSGLPQFNSFLYQPTPYSLMAYVDAITYLCAGSWMMTLYNFYFSMYIEFILRISFHFRVLAEDLRQLRSGVDVDEEEELQKLKSYIKDWNLLQWCVEEYNETLRFFLIGLFWLCFTTLGVYAAVILSMGSITKSWRFFFYPIYLFLFVLSFCVIGQHLKDSADEVPVGIYDCDWYTAPIPFRKLVLNVLTRCTHDTMFRASPFYDLDLQLLTRVLKNTYTLIAVFRNAMK